jgi:hypothetical protein
VRSSLEGRKTKLLQQLSFHRLYRAVRGTWGNFCLGGPQIDKTKTKEGEFSRREVLERIKEISHILPISSLQWEGRGIVVKDKSVSTPGVWIHT